MALLLSRWLLVAGCWWLVAGGWLLVAGCWLLVRLVEFCRLEAHFVLVSEQNAFKLLI
jgi:hypothetical protein